MAQSEHSIQKAFFDWAKLHPVAKRAYAIPNAAKRSPRLASFMLAEGLRKGVLDVCLPVPCGGSNALYIEFKAGSNGLTPEQATECDLLSLYGNAVLVAWDAEQAIDFVNGYLRGEVPASITILKAQRKSLKHPA